MLNYKLTQQAIFLTSRGTSTLSLCCKYKTDFSAASDAVEIFYKSDVLGKLEQTSSWEGSFKGNLLKVSGHCLSLNVSKSCLRKQKIRFNKDLSQIFRSRIQKRTGHRSTRTIGIENVCSD